MPPKKENYQYWLYDNKYENIDQFLDFVSSLVRKSNVRINMLLVTTYNDIEKELTEYIPPKFDVNIRNQNGILTLTVTKEFDDNRKVKVKIRIIRYHETPFYIILSDSKASDFKVVISKLMNKHFPTISRVFITSDQMRYIFEQLEESTKLGIQIDSSIVKRRLPRKLKGKESRIIYTNSSFPDIFDEAESMDGWVQSMKFTAFKVHESSEGVIEEEPRFFGVISRDCFISCRKNFLPFLEVVIPYSVKFALSRLTYLDSKSQTANNILPDPVVIKFKGDYFSDLSKNKAFIDAMKSLESSSISTYHSNPYIHLSLLDYLDGSSYDIWVLSTNRMVIVPQIRASNASMERLVKHVFERVQEGETEDYEQIANIQ